MLLGRGRTRICLRHAFFRSGEDVVREEKKEGDDGGDYMARVSSRQAMVRRRLSPKTASHTAFIQGSRYIYFLDELSFPHTGVKRSCNHFPSHYLRCEKNRQQCAQRANIRKEMTGVSYITIRNTCFCGKHCF